MALGCVCWDRLEQPAFRTVVATRSNRRPAGNLGPALFTVDVQLACRARLRRTFVLRRALSRTTGAAVTPTVSVVIPTIGRPSLARAVQSVLDQTHRVAEIIVVADTDGPLCLPSDDRITLIRTEVASGAARSRQLGIDAASGTVIALLDDDDEWHCTKLAQQLAAVDSIAGQDWIASSRMMAMGPGNRRRTWPRRLVEPGESISEYLFRFTDLGFGGAVLQTSTLCFPAELARKVRWDEHAGAVHDEPTWLIQVQRTFPGVLVIQLPEALSTYNVMDSSVSRDTSDRTDEYI